MAQEMTPERRQKVLEAGRRYYARHRERCIARAKEWKSRNPEARERASDKRRCGKPPRKKLTEQERIEARKESARKYARKYREQFPEKEIASRKKYKENNKQKVLATKRESQASRNKRTPKWSDRKACKAFYEIAVRVTKCTGIRFEVDHVIPLHGKLVSGLHVPENLRVIPAKANWKKGNRICLRDGL